MKIDSKKGMFNYISPEFIGQTIKLLKFLLIYSILFAVLALGLKFAIPFVIAFLLAMILRPLKNRILAINSKLKKFKLSEGLVSLVLTCTIAILALGLLIIIGYQIVIQTTKFLQYITNPITAQSILDSINNFINFLLKKVEYLDPTFVSKINEGLMGVAKLGTELFTNVGKSVLNLAISLPFMMISIFITLISTYFFTKDMEKIREFFKNIFSLRGKEVVKGIKGNMSIALGGYLKAYAVIMSTIATLSFIIYSLAGVTYALPIAILTAIVDFLPLVGAGLVYSILMISMYFAGNTTAVFILLIGLIIVVIVRQLLEQNLVASFIGVHPLVMIIGLFIALTPLGIGGMFYLVGACLLFQTVK